MLAATLAQSLFHFEGIATIGSAFGGNVFGTVPGWLQNLAAMNGTTFGLAFPPTILIWIALAIFSIDGLAQWRAAGAAKAAARSTGA